MIIVFGSINLDLIFRLDALPAPGETLGAASFSQEPGGKGANQAAAAAKDGARVMMAGAVGRDGLAAPALAGLRAAGVDLDRVRAVDGATGCAAICTDRHGANQIVVAAGANEAARATQVEDALLGPQATLLLQMESPPAETAALIRRARAAGARILLNLAPAAALPEPALAAVDLLLVNETETAWLAAHLDCEPDAGALHRRLGVGVLRTLGGAGSEAATRAGRLHVPAHPVRVVDSTAAGDCYAGVLGHALDGGHGLEAAMRRATAAAALCCTRAGSQGSLPTRAETDAAMRR